MHPRTVLSLGNFFGAAHFFLILYIITPYLATFFPASYTGLVVSGGALVTLAIFPFAPQLVSRFGARNIALVLALAQTFLAFFLSDTPSVFFVVVFTVLLCAISPLVAYQLDLLLEATVKNESTSARVRTAFLTAGNGALILAPLLVGFLLGSTEAYGRVFFVAALSLIPFLVVLYGNKVPEGKPPQLHALGETWRKVRKDRDLFAIVLAQGVLQSFYHLAPLYIPLYLHDVLFIPWSDLGWMFAVMLLPFLMIEYPAGALADRWLGDKELLLSGFLIMGIAFVLVGFIGIGMPLAITLFILVATRVGAALVEAMSEGHFFRRVSERDATTVSVFRMARPVAALVAPILGSLILLFFDYTTLFVATGIAIAIAGSVLTALLRDTR